MSKKLTKDQIVPILWIPAILNGSILGLAVLSYLGPSKAAVKLLFGLLGALGSVPFNFIFSVYFVFFWFLAIKHLRSEFDGRLLIQAILATVIFVVVYLPVILLKGPAAFV